MKILYILLAITSEGPQAHSIHADQQACDDAAYVLYEQAEHDSQCHAIATELQVQCTTDMSCVDFHGWEKVKQ